jgi:hypothetical protein
MRKHVICSLALGAASLCGTVEALAAPVAAYTTVDDPSLCKNGSPQVNCNIYLGKEAVYMDGGPVNAGLGEGTYFFAVLSPEDKSKNPNDLAPDGSPNLGLLSQDTWQDRLFTVDSNGVITEIGNNHHAMGKLSSNPNHLIQLMPYLDTPNPGGEYVLAICKIDPNTYDPRTNPLTDNRSCKFDNFKVKQSQDSSPIEALLPKISKDTVGTYDTTWNWTVAKSADRTSVTQLPSDGKVHVNYTVTVTHDGGTNSNYQVKGAVTVNNPNDADIFNVAVTEVGLSNATACNFDEKRDENDNLIDPGNATLYPGANIFPYTCNAIGTAPSGSVTNTAKISWGEQMTISEKDGSDLHVAAGSADATSAVNFVRAKEINGRVTVKDSLSGTLGTLTHHAPSPKVYTYALDLSGAAGSCVTRQNIASLSSGASANAGVQICEPTIPGARSMGFWQNPNGQAAINSAVSGSTCLVEGYLMQFTPFKDVANFTASGSSTNGSNNGKGNGTGASAGACAKVAAYYVDVFSKASGSNMETMLKAQMLAAALDVYFSGPGKLINTPKSLGEYMVDVSSYSTAFGGAIKMTINQALLYASGQDPTVGGGSDWYGKNKALQSAAMSFFAAIAQDAGSLYGY